MPSGPVAESESRFDSKLYTLSGEKDTECSDSWVRLGKVGTESDGFGTQDFEANTEFRHSDLSRVCLHKAATLLWIKSFYFINCCEHGEDGL